MANDTREIAKKMCRSLIDNHGYPYAAGYVESFLVSIIEKYVKDPTDLSMVHIDMLNVGIDAQLFNKKAS